MTENLRQRFDVEVIHRIDYGDFEELVEERFGHSYSFVADQEMRNDSTWSASVDVDDMDEYDLADVERFALTGEGSWMAWKLLAYLCAEGELSPGNYIIDVFW